MGQTGIGFPLGLVVNRAVKFVVRFTKTAGSWWRRRAPGDSPKICRKGIIKELKFTCLNFRLRIDYKGRTDTDKVSQKIKTGRKAYLHFKLFSKKLFEDSERERQFIYCIKFIIRSICEKTINKKIKLINDLIPRETLSCLTFCRGVFCTLLTSWNRGKSDKKIPFDFLRPIYFII